MWWQLNRTSNAAVEKMTMNSQGEFVSSKIEIVTHNCWGLKYISKHRHARLSEIGAQLASRGPPPHIVGLQECWTQADYQAIRRHTSEILPHGKFYYGGIFGAGLAILSKWPIIESSMVEYPLNGRPTAFFRGDWFVGKGVACAKIQFGKDSQDILEVFCTHLHAPYEREPHDSYVCHRTAQAWEISKLMRGAIERGHLTIALGDFNMMPLSLAHQLVTTHSRAQDVWMTLHPDSASYVPAGSAAAGKAGVELPSAWHNVTSNGTTCDSALNTWRWDKAKRKKLGRGGGEDRAMTEAGSPDPRGKRLDYIFVGQGPLTAARWTVANANVGMTMRHPTLKCSLSDHFSVEATLCLSTASESSTPAQPMSSSLPKSSINEHFLPIENYTAILAMISKYRKREEKQRRWRLGHFACQIVLTIACHVAVWWASPPSRGNYIAFILMLVATFGFAVGVLDGLIGGLFMTSELRALNEFEWEIVNVRNRAVEAAAAASSRE